MSRLFLAAGVAALAISAPAVAKPGGGHGGGNPHGGGGQAQAVQHGGGGGHGGGHGGGGNGGGQRMQAPGGGGHGGGPRFQAQRGGGHGPRMQVQRVERHGGGQRMQMQRFAQPRQHQQRQQMRAERVQHGKQMRQAQNRGVERRQMQAQRQQMRGHQVRQAQNRNFERQQTRMQRAENRALQHQQLRGNQQVRMTQNQKLDRKQMRANMRQFREQAAANQQFNRQLFAGNANFGGNAKDYIRDRQQAYRQALVGTSFAPLYYGYNAPTTYFAPTIAESFIGLPLSQVSGFAALSPLPASIAYLYPATPAYYYQYGDGYVYQVDRTSNLIAALIPLLAGGYMPGQYLPQPYMASYVPDYYGFNAFYPDYGDTCNRYVNGVIYEVDCYSGMVEDVVPVYASGYGVGQILPASYAYYNVPYQYRTLYYDTPDYSYWYAPGAIYQYEPRTSMITSVAALLSPGFTVGQALPVGYDVYNVPYAYRATYYDTPNAWYRYNNGYIYQVDPTTRLVTAIVASLLT